MLALVNGNFQLHRSGTRQARGSPAYFPLGLLSLQAYTRAHCSWEVEIINPEPLVCEVGGEVGAIATFLDSIAAPVLGLSVTALSLPAALAALRRRRNQEQRVVLGGPGLQGLPASFMRDFPEVDVAIYGEGEIPLGEALAWLDGAEVEIPSASYRRGTEVVHSHQPARLSSLDLVPPVSYSGLVSSPGPARVLMESSRGCPFKCVFCNSPGVWGSRVTTRSVAQLVAELRRLTADLGPIQVVFVDDLFTLSRKRVLAFCQALRQAALPVRWVCFGRVETVDRDLLQTMRDAGCQAISFGIEAGNDRVLRRLKKSFSVDQARQVIAVAGENLPVVETSFIRGFPFETVAEFRETLELMVYCHELGCHVKIYTLTPLRGAQLQREFQKSWRWHRGYRNPSLKEWFPIADDLVELFDQYPYLAWPFGYYDYPDREEKDAMKPSWSEEHHALAQEKRTSQVPDPNLGTEKGVHDGNGLA